MNNKALKCIEILYDRAYYNENMTSQIKKEFNTKEQFITTLITLYGQIAVSNIIHYSDVKPNFDISKFFENGSIVPLQKKDKSLIKSARYNLYKNMIESLKEGNYIFDSEGNIHIMIDAISLKLDSIKLNNLAEGLKSSLYQRVYLYNKKRENDITDENSLQNYLYHTKTMLVETNDIIPPEKIDKLFNITKKQTHSRLKYQPIVKVEDIIRTFEDNSSSVNFKVSRFKLPSNIYIVKKANQLGSSFYNLPLQKQKKLICEWILEYINCNTINNEVTQEYIKSIINPNYIPTRQLNKQQIIPGLAALYINIITNLNLDFTEIALSNFRIKTFLSESLQNHLLELQSLIKQINKKEDIAEEELVERIDRISKELNEIDFEYDTERLIEKNNELNDALFELKNGSSPMAELLTRRNNLQNIIHAEQDNCLSDIAFDNERIIALIKAAINYGRIYVNPLDKNKIIIETYNKELGRPTFQCEISMLKMLDFISTNNSLLEEERVVFK